LLVFGREKTTVVTRASAAADLVVLSGDPLTTPPKNLTDIEVLQTEAGGRMVFDKWAAGVSNPAPWD
jgi:predicted amidohydrolase YtcJ